MTLLLGKKLGMTRIYDDDGVVVPVTVLQMGPCVVMQVKSVQSDGYDAVQLGFDDVKKSRVKKPAAGHAKKAGTQPKRFVREERLSEPAQLSSGDELTVNVFKDIKYVDVTGTTKGKGYAGVMKRHGFKGMSASHGTERKHRHPGGIGSNSGGGGTGRSIRLGKKMAGHMGLVRSTSRNHQVVGIDEENNLLLVKGPVAGPGNGYVMVYKSRTKS